MKKIIVGLLLVSLLTFSAPVAHAATDLEVRQQLIILITQLIQVLQAQLNEMLAQQNQVPAPVEQPAPAATTPTVEQLSFTQAPKLVFKGELLSYLTWETNRPTTLVVSPILPDSTGWTTSFGAWESCGRANVSRGINSTCLIKVKDANGYTAETSINVFKDSIDQ